MYHMLQFSQYRDGILLRFSRRVVDCLNGLALVGEDLRYAMDTLGACGRFYIPIRVNRDAGEYRREQR